jgi:Tol biopolymer transport system component
MRSIRHWRLGLLVALAGAALLPVPPAAGAAAQTQLVYNTGTSGYSKVVASDPDGGNQRVVTPSGFWLRPKVSPDGTRIAFSAVVGSDTDQEIWIATIDGELIGQVTDNSANDASPFWLPDGERIGFFRGEDRRTLWTARLDGSDPVKYDQFPGAGAFSWSPDGKWIAFSRWETESRAGVYLVRADGSTDDNPVRLMDGGAAIWSPDSQQVAALRTAYIGGKWYSQIWKTDVEAAGEQLVGAVPGINTSSLAWSPQGDRFAFIRNWDVWTIATDGTDLQQVSDTARTEQYLDWGRVPQCSVSGTPNGDVLRGTNGDDVICGGAGNDRIEATGGDDTILGGAGTDKIDYRDAADRVLVDMRRVRARSGETRATLYGVESVLGSRHADEMFGGDVRDSFAGYAGDDALIGRGGDDTLSGGDGDDVLRPGLGGDDVNGGNGRDSVSFIDAQERVRVNLGSNFAFGQGDDLILAIEKVIGSAYDDFIIGTDGANVLRGGDGEDTINGQNGPDDIYGGDERDFLYGKGGADELYGDDGRDYIDGGDADDACHSGYQTVAC